MQTVSKQIASVKQQKSDYSSVMVVYRSEDSWRGFVMPFGITCEAETRKEAISILKEMIASYTECLREYNNPDHLADVPLSDIRDNGKWTSISENLMNKLLNKVSQIDTPDYYAEAQLPA